MDMQKKSVFDSQCLKSKYVCYPWLFTFQSVLLLYILKGQAKKFEFINHKAILYNNLSFTLSSLAPMPQPDQRLGTTYRQPKIIFFPTKVYCRVKLPLPTWFTLLMDDNHGKYVWYIRHNHTGVSGWWHRHHQHSLKQTFFDKLARLGQLTLSYENATHQI